MVVVDDGADAHEIRCAPIVNGVPGTPVTQLVTKTRPAATITGLTPVTAYSIQVRSFADATGFSDWSDPITHTVRIVRADGSGALEQGAKLVDVFHVLQV